LRTTDEVVHVLGGFCVSVHRTPSGYAVFWFDTPTEKQKLIWRQLQVADPGPRLPDVRPARQEADFMPKSASFFSSKAIHEYAKQIAAYAIATLVARICL
jgi:hypothetical protein